MNSNSNQILLVEDSITQSLKLSGLLEGEGFEVHPCFSAEEALEELSKRSPDLLIVDYYLPGLRGDELCRRVRMSLADRQIPILMFTVDDSQAMELSVLESGADDYIPKSIDPDILVARIRTLLRKGHQTQAVHGLGRSRMQDVSLLAVDDSPTYLEKIVLELSADGYHCERAASGSECLRKVENSSYDCVLLDLVMPEMDGIEVCKRIAEMRPSMHHPMAVLMLTAHESKDDLTRALEAGADDFVGKSSDMTVLKGRIRALLRRNFYLEENQRITEELRAKEMEATRARMEKEAAEAQAAIACELERANEELQRANGELQDFSYSISHDLRAPLRGIDGFSGILLADYAHKLDAPGQEHLKRIRQACGRMNVMIDALLNLGRLTRLDLRRELFDATVMCHEIVDQLQSDNPDRRVAFHAHQGVLIDGDPVLMRAVFENLLENAWKFTSNTSEGHIDFGIHQTKGRTVHYIRDNGAGFDMAHKGNLFKPFQRLHSNTEFPGTGVGLAAVMRIINRHNGQIWAEAEMGKGATFYFTVWS